MALDATVLAALLQACASNVAPVTMQAIIAVESEGNPYRIGVNSGARLKRQPDNLADAIATAESLTHRGADFDAGLMQINSANFARYGLNARSVFDPCTNLRVGAAILTDNYSRARDDGHPRPWQAAVSEYNTGSRSRGLANGYVGKVYAAAGSRQALSGGAAQSGRNWTAEAVAGLIARTFDARITDTWRAMNAAYGAEHSFHKYGRAVDFVPRAGLGSIDRAQIRSLMAANGIAITELLGPGDPGHSDHWHVCFRRHRCEQSACLARHLFPDERGQCGKHRACPRRRRAGRQYRVPARIRNRPTKLGRVRPRPLGRKPGRTPVMRGWGKRTVSALPVAVIAATSTPAIADVGGIATTVLAELTALALPAITLGVIWLGVLVISRRASLMTFLVMCVGIVIVISGGFF